MFLHAPSLVPWARHMHSGVSCQLKDWGSAHKFECENLRQLRAKAAAAAAAGSPQPPHHITPDEDAPVPRQVLFPYQQYLVLRKASGGAGRPPVGFTNLGNNCYANAALQCLLVTRPLRAYLDQGLHSRTCNKPSHKEWCLLCELQVRGAVRGLVCGKCMSMSACMRVCRCGAQLAVSRRMY